jgi:polysaccharide deacetylase family protein (PEP-CTERM system associated)
MKIGQITIDVEDYRSLIIRDKLGISTPTSPYVDGEVENVLDFLDDLNIVATCFIVGRLAEERPHVVRSIADRGHDVASHSYAHMLMPSHTPHSFDEDLRMSINVLEDITGKPVRGFRAPAFSLGPQQEWAFEIMACNGIEYDSSVRLTWPFDREAGRRLIASAAACRIEEYPGLALGWRALRLPLGGGGGLRLVPEWVTRYGLNWARRSGYAVPVYVHPYDLTSKSPSNWPPASWKRRARLEWLNWMQHLGRSNVRKRLRNAVNESSHNEIHIR